MKNVNLILFVVVLTIQIQAQWLQQNTPSNAL